jgi:hypothetical protein
VRERTRVRLATNATSAPIPSAVDPHTVERAWFRASRWSAPLYERPGRPGPRLLGSAWVDGGRDGSIPRTPLRARSRERRPLHPGVGRSPAGGSRSDHGGSRVAVVLLAFGSLLYARPGPRPGWSGAETGAQARPGAGPRGVSGASRLEPVEKVVTHSVERGVKSYAQAGRSTP